MEEKEETLDKYFLVNNKLSLINNVEDKIGQIKIEVEMFYKRSINIIDNFLNEIKEYKYLIRNLDKFNEEEIRKIQKREKFYEEYYLFSKMLKAKDMFKDIFNLIDDLDNLINEIKDFDSGIPKNKNKKKNLVELKDEDSNIFNFSDKENSSNKSNFYDDLNNEKNADKTNKSEYNENNNINNDVKNNNINIINIINPKSLKCTICNGEMVTQICGISGKLLCKNCCEKINKEPYINYELENINLDKEMEKENSLKSFSKILDFYLFKFNFLLNLKKNDSIKFPFIPDDKINDFNKHQDFLNEINNLYLRSNIDDEKNINDENEKNINNENCINNQNNRYSLKNCKEVNGRITKEIEEIFNKKIKLEKDISDDDDDLYSDGCAFNNNNEEEEYDLIKNSFIYFLNLVQKSKSDFEENISQVIIEKISNTLYINKDNILILYDSKIDNFVKSKFFFDLPINQFKNENPIFNQFYEIKLLFENLLVEDCKIPKEKFDYKGNFISPNTNNNNKRGKEIYIPPYGWYGIGLNVIGKYDEGDDKWINDNTEEGKWAIAYHGINYKLNSDKIKNVLNDIILNDGISKAINESKANKDNIRNRGKEVGKGIFLTPFISIAEHYTGIISFNNKKYKVLLMARVKIENIREPEKSNFWVLNQEDVRIYRILLKEVY